ncbi:MAG: prepilin-type N-terminal cleavage/methylation domain-containing protein [Calditrichaeota bacterium]|nr:prepilin-type N-terminal cleavage/methylation domain-containing protein [Calditrichota bacterium]MCB9392016.1 prepilin-type N-terminal cleavage/methylation domain-containing protein [Calditrichota bacterium]
MLNRLNRRRKNQKGFTLIEILIVVVIVAILAAISVPIYLEYVNSARASDAKTAINSIWQAAQIYYQDRGDYPGSVEDLLDSKYLELSPSTQLQWTFNFTGSPPDEIIATSTDQMRGGAGKEVRYQIKEGKWFGYGLPEPDEQ